MTNRASGLVLADEATECDELACAIADCGLAPIATRGSEATIRLLGSNNPVVVLVGWSTSAAHRHARGCEEVLRAVYRQCGNTPTFVYGAGIDSDVRLKARIARAHPLAIVHDRTFPVPLPERLQAALGRWVGDLSVDRGCVLHFPTGTRVINRAAMTAVVAYPRDFHVRPGSAMYIAVWRLRGELRDMGSVVSMSPGRGGFYRLVLDQGRGER